MTQHKLISDEVKEKLSDLESIIHNPITDFFITDFPILGFLLANIFIYLVFIQYWSAKSIIYVIFFLFGLFLSFAIIRPNYFQNFSGFGKRARLTANFIKSLIKKDQTINQENIPKITLTELFSFTLRTFFFNFLNDLFIVLVFWFLLFWSGVLIGIIANPISAGTTYFSQTIGLIGIISGLFKFYVTYYRKSSYELYKSIISNWISRIQNVSFIDFRRFLLEKKKDSLVTKIDRILLGKDELSQQHITPFSIGRVSYLINQNYYISNSISQKDTDIFKLIENYSQLHPSHLNRNDLLLQYQEYFQLKLDAAKLMIQENEIKILRDFLFGMIIFSDEMLFSYIKTNLNFSNKKQNPLNFVEYYSQYLDACNEELFIAVIRYKSPETDDSIVKFFFGSVILVLIIIGTSFL